MSKRHRPRRGSLAFSPRKRARSETCRIKREEIAAGMKIQGFAGYKAGMTHLSLTDNIPNSLTKGMEVSVPATVIETPPMKAEGFRLYKNSRYGKKAVTEAWAEKGSGLDKIADIIKSSDVHAFDDLSMSMILSTLLDLCAVYNSEGEVLFTPDVLHIDLSEYFLDVKEGVKAALSLATHIKYDYPTCYTIGDLLSEACVKSEALALNIAYPTSVTIKPLIQHAYSDARNLSINACIYESDTMVYLLAKACSQAQGLAAYLGE